MGSTDVFENEYMAKLKALLAGQGVVIDYERDRAAIDTGLHLFVEAEDHTRTASPARVWFQAKGRTKQTLPLAAYRAADTVAIELKVAHLRFWYAFPEPVYVTVYIESTDEFLAEDVSDLVDRVWPRGTFYQAVAGRETVTVHVPTTTLLDQARLEGMLRHRSMRIDGPAFRGRPLGHRFDPTRSVIAEQAPEVWERVVEQLLAAHDFRRTKTHTVGDNLSIVEGWLHETMSWQSPAFATYGYQHDPMEFREDPPYETLQGDLRIVLDSSPGRHDLTNEERTAVVDAVSFGAISAGPLTPLYEPFSNEYLRGLIAEDTTDEPAAGAGPTPTTVVFMNARDLSGTGGLWRSTMRGVEALTEYRQLGAEAVTFLLLTATLVYLDVAPELRWDHVNYLH